MNTAAHCPHVLRDLNANLTLIPMPGAQRERQAEERRAAQRARREAGGSQGDWALVDAHSEERVGMRTRKRASAAQERAGEAAEARAQLSQEVRVRVVPVTSLALRVTKGKFISSHVEPHITRVILRLTKARSVGVSICMLGPYAAGQRGALYRRDC